MPTVSIVISVYNGIDYLLRCTRAILEQTFCDWECLLVDDGSPDGVTPALCDEIGASDPRFRVFHKENGGADSGWRYGIEHARGEWIIFVDQDDLIPPWALETMLKAQQQNPSSMLLWRWCHDTAEWAAPTQELLPVQHRSLSETGLLYTESLLYFAWARLFSREILLKHKVMPPPGITYGGDLIFCMEYIRACVKEGLEDYAVLQLPLYYYETGNQQSVTTRLRPTYCDDELVTTAYLLEGFSPPLSVPDEDFGRVLHSCVRTLAEGFAYVLYREEALSKGARREKVRRYLAHPALSRLLEAFRQRRLYSPYCFWLSHKWYRPACAIAHLKEASPRMYERLYWLGWWLHSFLTGKKDQPYL